MQHPIRNLGALVRACERLGLELILGQPTYRWSQLHPAVELPAEFARGFPIGRCRHAIRLAGNPDAFEVGLVPLADGSGYGLVCDFYRDGFGLAAAVGPGCRSLIEAYESWN